MTVSVKPKRETYRCTGELRLQGGGERTWIRCDLKSVHSGDHSNYAGYAWPRAAVSRPAKRKKKQLAEHE